MIESNTQEPNDQVDFFQQMSKQFEQINENFSGTIEKTLPNEMSANCKTQAEAGEKFCQEVLQEAKDIDEKAKALKKKIADHTDQGMNKSYLKAAPAKYERVLQTFDMEGFEKLIQRDIDACTHMEKDASKEKIAKVVTNYNEFMKVQQEQLKEFIFKQQKLMYGFVWTPIMSCTKLFTRQKKIEMPTWSWPEQTDIAEWPLENKMKLSRIHWKCMHGYMSLSAIKFEFSNGIMSKPCETEHQRHGNWRSFEIDQTKTITKFCMLIQEDRDVVNKIKIMSGDEEIVSQRIHEHEEQGKWVEIDIPKGREIIGLVANKNDHQVLRSLGLQLWTPNPKAF